MQSKEESMGNETTKPCCTSDSRSRDADLQRRNMEAKPFDRQHTESVASASQGIESVKGSILQSPKIKEQYLSHENLFTRLVAHKQDHLLSHMEDLNNSELDTFYDILYDIDFELMDMMYNHLILNPPKKEFEQDKLEPISNVLKISDVDENERAKLIKTGLELIARGKCIAHS